jgi:hypothetical protein
MTNAENGWPARDDLADAPPPKRGCGKWALIGLVVSIPLLVCFGFCGVFGVGLFTAMRSSQPYIDALEAVRTSPEVRAALGEPIEPGYFVTGNISLKNDDGVASLSFDVNGPRGTATVSVDGNKLDGVWTYTRIDARLASNNELIELLDTAAVGPAEQPAAEHVE